MTSSLESFYIITFSKKFYLLFHFIDNGFLFMVCPFQQKIFYCTFTFNVLYKSDLFINQINHVFLKYIESSAIVLYKSYIPGQNKPLNICTINRNILRYYHVILLRFICFYIILEVSCVSISVFISVTEITSSNKKLAYM